MNKVTILHLSDLHFGAEVDSIIQKSNRAMVLDSLIEYVVNCKEQTKKPDIVVISGDIGWRGKSKDYENALHWINELLLKLNLPKEHLIICPGNHDIDRDKARFFITPSDSKDADDLLGIESLSEFERCFSSYIEFCEKVGLSKLRIDKKENYLVGYVDVFGIRFVVLNSSWYYRKDKDKDLWIGQPHLQVLKTSNQIKTFEGWSIAVLHHPPDSLHYDELHSGMLRKCTYELLTECADIILSGHTHDCSIVNPDIKHANAPLIIGGSTYSGSDYYNNFSFIEIDRDNNEVFRYTHEYRPSLSRWKYFGQQKIIVPKKQTYSIGQSNSKVDKNETEEVISYSLSRVEVFKYLINLELTLRTDVIQNREHISIPTEMEKKALARASENGDVLAIEHSNVVEWLDISELFELLINSKVINGTNFSLSDSKNLLAIRKKFEERSELLESEVNLVIRIKDNYPTTIGSKIEVPILYEEYPLPIDFDKLIGRNDKIKTIKRNLNANTPVSLIGIGGIGKTAIIQKLICDYQFGYKRPFDKIYFMSFKDSVFRNGRTEKIKKEIYNYSDLFELLSKKMDINIKDLNEKELIEAVITRLLKEKSLLILDNLETEIIGPNFSEFVELANRFIDDPNTKSRLLIASRKGLNESERKIKIDELNKSETIELLGYKIKPEILNEKPITKDDYSWIKKYASGNPGLLIALSNLVNTTTASISELRSKYNIKNEINTIKLNSVRNNFLEFCFTNTIVSFQKNLQLLIAVISYYSYTLKIDEINSELLQYFSLEFVTDSDESVDFELLQNIGFMTRNKEGNYSINALIVEFVATAESSEILNFKKLKKTPTYSRLVVLIDKVRWGKTKNIFNINDILSRLYFEKYQECKDIEYLELAFNCTKSTKELYELICALDSRDVVNRIMSLDWSVIVGDEESQNKFALKAIMVLKKVNNEINKELNSRDTHDYAALNIEDIMNCISMISENLSIFKEDGLSRDLRKQLCNLHMNMSKEEDSLKFIDDDAKMADTCLQLYARIISKIDPLENEKFEYFHNLCLKLRKQCSIRNETEMLYRHNLGTYYFNAEKYEEAIFNFNTMNKLYGDMDVIKKKSKFKTYLYNLAYLISSQKKSNSDYYLTQKMLFEEFESKNFKELSNPEKLQKRLEKIILN